MRGHTTTSPCISYVLPVLLFQSPLPCTTWSDSEVARLLAISSPPASPLSPWSSSPPQIPFPLSPPSPVLTAPPPSPIRSLGYQAATIRMRAKAATTSHSLLLPPPFILSPTRPDAPPPMFTSAPTSFPPLLLPYASHREDRPMVNFTTSDGVRSGVTQRRYVGYGINGFMGLILLRPLQGAQLDQYSGWCTHEKFETLVRRDKDEIYTDVQEIHRVTVRDRSRRRAISDLIEADRRRREEIRELRSVDRTRQQQIIQTLTVMQTLQREMIPLQGLVTTLQEQVTALQGQVMALQGQVTALQGHQGPTGGPTQPELPEEAGSSS
ncbi:hypothetical protein Tco_0541324 [Tanacetum coccineum]